MNLSNMHSRSKLQATSSRRQFLANAGGGLSALGVAAALADSSRNSTSEIDPANPYEPRPSHFPAKAKSVIVVFCSGALSHVDTFDFKPELERRHG